MTDTSSLPAISIVGAGAIGTALGNVLARKKMYDINLLSIEQSVVDAINNTRFNEKYIPNIKLSKNLKATKDPEILKNSSVIFLAIPSDVVYDYLSEIKPFINNHSIIVNLAKGFSNNKKTIIECIRENFNNPVCSFKGPSFATDLINKAPTAFTLGSINEEHFTLFLKLFKDTNVYLDYTSDLRGVEILSILKNIYAIAAGIIDAQHNSPNLRYLFLTRAFNEIKELMKLYGCSIETMFNYCGYGDFSLTAHNDLSRNRTLGLLIGKGFFVKNISEKVTLEGKNAVSIIFEQIGNDKVIKNKLQIISELHKVFNNNYNIKSFFEKTILRQELPEDLAFLKKS